MVFDNSLLTPRHQALADRALNVVNDTIVGHKDIVIPWMTKLGV
jgi:hypothetical protein